MTAGSTAVRADAAALLSDWWSRPVAEEVSAWDEAWPAATLVAAELGLHSAAVDALAGARRRATVGELLDEYERLFVGPGATPCPPYESVWLRQDGLRRSLMSSASTEVADLYRRAGVNLAGDVHELPDHIAIEWEALAWASAGDAQEVADTLLEEHLRVWLPPFCAAVEEHSMLPFYTALAVVTRAWAAALPGRQPPDP